MHLFLLWKEGSFSLPPFAAVIYEPLLLEEFLAYKHFRFPFTHSGSVQPGTTGSPFHFTNLGAIQSGTTVPFPFTAAGTANSHWL